MACCSGCARYAEAERQFGPAIAARDLERYRRKGPDAASRLLLNALRDHVNSGVSLLDIGAGVGVLDFELLANGARTATLVDASRAYLDAAGREAESRKVADRLRCVVGDFAPLAEGIEAADVVTMHRVVCCYPDHASLLRAAVKHARRVFAFSYPRDRWYIRSWLALENVGRRLFGNPFRTFMHAPAAMEACVTQEGLVRTHRSRTFVWSVDIYTRTKMSLSSHDPDHP
ncbi:MAG: class I SAM-dependent methyltransferase [Acidobacteriota bacterium]